MADIQRTVLVPAARSGTFLYRPAGQAVQSVNVLTATGATMVPVAKGNGYGVGNVRLATEARRLGADCVAVGTVLFFAWGQRPEETVRHDIAHARAEAGIERLVQKGQRFTHRGVQLAARGQQGGQLG